MIQIHALHVFAAPNCIANVFPEINAYWQGVEVPLDCSVFLRMVFKYRAREYLDPKSGFWVV